VEEAVFIAEAEGRIYVRAQGHVTAALCPELKARIFPRLEAEPGVEAVYFDLGPCEYMDSTFLGLIVGLNKRLKLAVGKPVVLLHVNDTCLGLLKTIGVTKLVELSAEEVPFPHGLSRVGPGPRATAEFLLDAHEELSDLSEENKKRFSTLTDTLRSALGKGED